MTDEEKKADPSKTNERNDKIVAQAEAIITKILRDHPQLRAVREIMRRGEEPTDKFAREFLKVFRQRMQSEC